MRTSRYLFQDIATNHEELSPFNDPQQLLNSQYIPILLTILEKKIMTHDSHFTLHHKTTIQAENRHIRSTSMSLCHLCHEAVRSLWYLCHRQYNVSVVCYEAVQSPCYLCHEAVQSLCHICHEAVRSLWYLCHRQWNVCNLCHEALQSLCHPCHEVVHTLSFVSRGSEISLSFMSWGSEISLSFMPWGSAMWLLFWSHYLNHTVWRVRRCSINCNFVVKVQFNCHIQQFKIEWTVGMSNSVVCVSTIIVTIIITKNNQLCI